MKSHLLSTESSVLTKNHRDATLVLMAPVPSDEYLERFRMALRMEIKAEMGRQSLTPHALATLVGENPQYVNQRILTVNKKTGRFVAINVSDLAKFAGALELDPAELVQKARSAVDESEGGSSVTPIKPKGPKRPPAAELQVEAALDRDGKPKMGEE